MEIILGAAVFSVFSFAIVIAVLQSVSAQRSGERTEFARLFALEGIEAARALRAQDFDLLAETEGSGIRFSGGKWELKGESDTKEGFVRAISISKARRNNDGDIAGNGGEADEDIMKITSRASQGDYAVEYETYLSRREIPAGP